MSNNIVIKVENLSKQYRIGTREAGYRTFRETLVDAAKAPFLRVQEAWSMAHRAWNKNKTDPIQAPPDSKLQAPSSLLSSSDDTFWALKDVSFEVKRGEVVGIIGRNGAGKSTLLKILAKITEPTEGRVELRGRVGSLLEVGTGFHPELSGHENIYLYGAILGMDRWEVTRKFDEIVAFAELEKFVDTPVKRYSSGMYMRLAFAVAAHLEPEILLVDEVLAVGDAQFQKKCLCKMEDISSEGRTVLFVSHNMAAIRHLCTEAVYIKEGKISYYGSVPICIAKYMELFNDQVEEIESHITFADPKISINSITINGTNKDRLQLSDDRRTLNIEIHGELYEPNKIELEARLFDLNEIPLAIFSPGHDRGYSEVHPRGKFELVGTINLPRMNKGEYYIYLYITQPGVAWWVKIPNALKIVTEGSPTSTGQVFEYNNGAGWILLD